MGQRSGLRKEGHMIRGWASQPGSQPGSQPVSQADSLPASQPGSQAARQPTKPASHPRRLDRNGSHRIVIHILNGTDPGSV